MKWSLKFLFTIVLLILVLFRQHDEFRGSRLGSGFRLGRVRRGPIDIVDFALIFVLIMVFYYRR